MYKTRRRTAGFVLAAVSVLLCVLPLCFMNHHGKSTYRSGNCLQRPLHAVPVESNGPVRINAADTDELTVLKGVGETIADLIEHERRMNGQFRYAEDLLSVKGIGAQTLAGFRNMIDLTPYESEE